MSAQPDLRFTSVAEEFDRGRPGYPREAAVWLAGEEPLLVLEVGAGTGKLTEALIALGHEVHATDPDDAMLAVLRRRLPDVPTSVAAAERLPAADASYDLVVAGQVFDWLDPEQALPEIARVLAPDGRLALVRNDIDARIPWVKRFAGIVGEGGDRADGRETRETLVASGYFGFVEMASFKNWQQINRESVQDLVVSRSQIAALGDDGRRAKVAEALALYDSFGRGMDGMQLPYAVSCVRAKVTGRRRREADREAAGDDPGTGAGAGDGDGDGDGGSGSAGDGVAEGADNGVAEDPGAGAGEGAGRGAGEDPDPDSGEYLLIDFH